jgi:hypothetical protein
MYSLDALAKLRSLQQDEVELSKSSIAIPSDDKAMDKWQDYVVQRHELSSAA